MKHGAQLETENPAALVFEADHPGIVKQEFLDERVLSAIVEGLIEPDELPGFLNDLKETQRQVDTVFSVDLIMPLIDGKNPAEKLLRAANVEAWPNGKKRVGLVGIIWERLLPLESAFLLADALQFLRNSPPQFPISAAKFPADGDDLIHFARLPSVGRFLVYRSIL